MSSEKIIEQLGNNPELIALVADGLDAAGFGKQVLLRRQRADAARRRLARARKFGAPDAEIKRLERRVAIRADGVARAEQSFAKANVRRPVSDTERGQVFVLVEGHDPKQTLSAALVSEEKVIDHGELTKGRFALLSVDQDTSNLRLQLSLKRVIVFRDAESFDLNLGEVIYRRVDLSELKIRPKPPPTKLQMPDLSGQSKSVALVILKRLGIIKVDISEKVSTAPEGVVIGQVPEAGDKLAEGEAVKLTISKRKPPVGGDDLFLNELAKAVERDDRWKSLSASRQPARRVLSSGGIKDKKTLAAVLKLKNDKLRERFKLATLREAVTFRSILSKAGKAIN